MSPPESTIEEYEILDLLTTLVDKSLVAYDDATGRYRLLETVRQFGRDRLLESAGSETVFGRHLECFLGLAEQAQQGLFGPEQRAWLDRLEREHDNLRAALAWSEAHERGDAGLRLGAALWRFWSVRGYLAEGRERLRSALLHPAASAPTVERAKALDGAGLLAMNCYDFTAASALYEEALSIGRELGAGRVIAMACNSLGDSRRYEGDGGTARSLYDEALRFGREVDDQWDVAYALTALGIMAIGECSFAEARSLLEEGLAIKRALGDKRSIAYSLVQLADLALAEETTSEARSLYEESLVIRRELGDKRWIALSLSSLGSLDEADGDFMAARARLAESAAIFVEVGDRNSGADNLKRVAQSAAVQGQSRLAARIFGAAERLREHPESVVSPADVPRQDSSVAGVRDVLGEAEFEEAWKEGRAMTLEQAIEFALSEADEHT